MGINVALVGARGTSSGSSVSTTAGTSTGGVGSVFLLLVSFDPGTNISTVSDSKGNTYSLIGSVVTAGTAKLAAYICEGGTGGASHTGSMTFSGSAFPTLHLLEVTVAATSTPLDIAVSGSDSATPYTLSSGTLAQAAEAVIAMCEINAVGNVGSYSVTGGFTILSEEPDADNYWTSGVAAQITAATTAVTASFTRTNGGAATLSGLLIVSIKEATGGASYSLTAAQGSYSLTGQAAGLRYGRKLAAGQGSYALTGQTVGLAYSGAARILTAAAGSYSLTGQSVTLRAGRKLVAAQGSYAITGQSALLKRGLKLAAGSGTYAITGSDALADYAITASAGAYVLTGQSVGLLASRKLGAGQGSYSLTGQAANLRFGRKLIAAQGSYALTGRDAALNYSGSGAKTLSANQGTYTLTGQDATLRLARRLVAAQGAYALTGQSANLLRTLRLVVGVGSYALTGQPAALRYARRFTAAQGTYTLAGQSVALSYSGAVAAYTLSAGAGSYLLTGYAVTLTVARVTSAPRGGGSALIFAGTRRPPVISGRRPGNINTRRT